MKIVSATSRAAGCRRHFAGAVASALLCAMIGVSQAQTTTADSDGNGLIEITSLGQLNALRHDLDGDGTPTGSAGDQALYRTAFGLADGANNSCAGDCEGYELTGDLDFDVNGDGRTWSRSGQSYRLDSEDRQADYFPVDGDGAGGWRPIGGENPFVAVFDGNSHTISNLAVRTDTAYIGLFGVIGAGAVIRNLGLVDNLADYTGSSDGNRYIGGLVGRQNGGSITASYATGPVAGGDGNKDGVGGLVGVQSSGSITASYATGAADGGDGDEDLVGGLVGLQGKGSSITASYATGTADGGGGNEDGVGGLVGWQSGGSITASYATGDANGRAGDGDRVGGLVGSQEDGSITASYATGAAAGGGGNLDSVGGLVGLQSNGSMIAASYARGAADGGEGEEDRAGGLVGWQLDNSIITASYSTGAAAGGGGGGDRVGGLVGWQEGGSITASYATGAADGGKGGDDAAGGLVGERGTGTITVSYGFGEAMGERNQGSDGFTKPAVPGGSETITSATQLTAEVAGSAWNAADSHSLGAWDFGDGSQIPALNYADYDGSGAVFDCDQFPAGACGALLPGQDSLSAGEPPAAGLEFGATATLTGSVRFGRVQILSWSWRQLSGPEVALSGADSQQASFTAPVDRDPLVFELTAVDSEGRRYSDRISLVVNIPADLDGDGLLEIHNLTDLHNMRYNLAGTSYSTGTVSAGDSSGCPQTGCVGYELMQDLDFDADGDGATWSGDSEGGYRLDPDDHHPDYFPVDENGAGGWRPIVGGLNPFAAVFEGNSHTISNLAIRRNSFYIGLFGRIGGGVVGQQVAFIRNLGLVDNLADYTGSSGDNRRIGGLVGLQSNGSITASYATGPVDGGDGDNNYVGGLVGRIEIGSIRASYATGAVDGGDGDFGFVGGLVGYIESSSIRASYATGAVDGGDGDFGFVGGLVGYIARSSIRASYATGAAAGGDGNDDTVGGLVGVMDAGASIAASYATGAADGGDGDEDLVGGLVGRQLGSITASYATGDADGGDGDFDSVGGLVGVGTETLTASYGFGEAIGHEPPLMPGKPPSEGSAKPAPQWSSAAQLSAANAGSAWNAADSHTLGAWDFGTDEQVPALNYADYDGAGAVFDCDQFPAGACGVLLPGQDSLSAGEPPASGLEFGAPATLTGSVRFGRVQILSWRWRQLGGTTVSLRDAEGPMATFRAPAPGVPLVFELSATDSEGIQYSDRISLEVAVDGDGDGLIEIRNLTMLHNMRHDLEGASYKISAGAEGNNLGCPEALCRGYELVQHLDFDTDGDGTWSGDGEGGYRLDPDDHHPDYFPVDEDGAGGWRPIGGDNADGFVAVFDGNGHTISNLAIRSNISDIGLFGAVDDGAVIRNLGLIDNLADSTGAIDRATFIGGLVGDQRSGSITASYATGAADGGGGDFDSVGGLVGWQQDGSITASYATGAAAGGGGGENSVGGLVGQQAGGMITASYATGAAVCGDGGFNSVGGLVGQQAGGMITASYATGAADGGGGNGDIVGGLVGYMTIRASVAASYATGAAAGGDGDDDSAGRLVGRLDGAMITASYGFGGADGENQGSHGSPPVSTATGLSAINAGDIWNTDTVATTLGAWDFGDGSQIPALNYADYDGSGAVFDCDRFPAGACGALLPGQDSLSAGEPPASGLEFGATATLTGSVRFGRVQIRSWRWRQLEGTEVSLRDAEGPMATFEAPAPGASPWVFDLSATDSEGRQYSDRISLEVAVDGDGDGLIEIRNLTMLHNMRHDLEGASYKTSASAEGNNLGCPEALCRGYELVQHLDFDGDGDGATWSGDSEGGYRLDPDDRHPDYFPVNEDDAGGWRPIGDLDQPFVAVFEGNSHTISHLAIRRDQTYVGLFGAIGEGAMADQAVAIGNLGLVDNLADYTGSSDEEVFIGGLVGRQETGTISASYATGAVDGGDGGSDSVGGLVGWQETGTISASYATGAADGGDGSDDYVGGLVGWQEGGTISLSYATGAADGGGGASDQVGGLVGAQSGTIILSFATGAAAGGNGAGDAVGGLVGRQSAGSIRASYATGAAAGGDSVGGSESSQEGSSISAGYIAGPATGGDNIGGLVGWQEGGSIRASYATGEAVGGAGNDVVGALVGVQYGTIRSSYATGHARGGAGDDVVGALVGELVGGRGTGSIVASYAAGNASGGEGGNDAVGALVGALVGGGQITASVIASYGFGQVDGEEIFGSQGTPLPEGVEEVVDLTRDNAGQGWSDIDWDFGTGAQFPALAHNGTLLPGQGRAGGGGGGSSSGGGGGGTGGGGGGGGSLNPLALALLALPFLPGLRRRPIPHQ